MRRTRTTQSVTFTSSPKVGRPESTGLERPLFHPMEKLLEQLCLRLRIGVFGVDYTQVFVETPLAFRVRKDFLNFWRTSMKRVRTLPALVGVVLIVLAGAASAKCYSRPAADRETDALIKAVTEAGLQPSLEWLVVQANSPSSQP